MVVALIPAAGHATRLGRQPSSKEVLNVGGRPMMDFLLERLSVAQPDEIRVVTRPAKEDVTRYATDRGARVIHGEPADVSESLTLGLEGLADEDEALIGFPDSRWEPPDGFVRVLEALRDDADLALGLFANAELERSDVVICSADGRVRSVAVKPERPPSDLIWGIAAARVSVLRGLRAGSEVGEHFSTVAAAGRTRGVFLSGEWLDIGTPEALAAARAG